MNLLKKILKENPIVYVTRDLERASGISLDTSGYFVVANYSDFAQSKIQNRANILLIKKERILDTWELLGEQEVIDFINKIEGCVLVFKNTAQIERICAKQSWSLLNPSAKLANDMEGKISQIDFFKKFKKNFLDYKISKIKDIVWQGQEFILQFNSSHTGSGTLIMKNAEDLEKLQNKFPNRLARVADFISGPVFTSNNVVNRDRVLLSNISYQITGLRPFTNSRFATIGNDWGVVSKILEKEKILEYRQIVLEIGEYLCAKGWRGLFGIDIILDSENDKLKIIEINARQPASTVYESELQDGVRNLVPSTQDKINIFTSHLLSLSEINFNNDLMEIQNGSQIILRKDLNKNINLEKIIPLLEELGCSVIVYDNEKENSDLLRIQSKESIVVGHNVFSELGERIREVLNSNF